MGHESAMGSGMIPLPVPVPWGHLNCVAELWLCAPQEAKCQGVVQRAGAGRTSVIFLCWDSRRRHQARSSWQRLATSKEALVPSSILHWRAGGCQ